MILKHLFNKTILQVETKFKRRRSIDFCLYFVPQPTTAVNQTRNKARLVNIQRKSFRISNHYRFRSGG